MQFSKQNIGRVLGPLVFFLILFLFHPEGLSKEANAVLASVAWVAIWWVTEAIPIYVTALLPLILFPLTGGLSLTETATSYGHKYIFLYMGGFILAIAIEKWNLHRRIALTIINLIGTNVINIILGFMLATAFLSMWISNTAAAVIILPIAMAIVYQLNDNPDTEKDENKIFGKALMLAIAYSASIGGIATLIGTPTNLVLAGVVQTTFGKEITFSEWFVLGFPIAIILLFLCWYYLTRFAFTFKQKDFPGGRSEISARLKALGKMGYEEKSVLVVFAVTAFAWIARSFLLQRFIPKMDDTIIAMMTVVILFLLPTREKGKRLMDWQDAVKLPWGILLLFGGGLTLALGFDTSGLALWIGSKLSALQVLPFFLLLMILISIVNFMTEITSNIATTAILLPVLVSLAPVLGVHPYYLMIAATLAASCAFMLPVATPPNAVVFGSGYLEMQDMVKKGFWLNIISILILTVVVYIVLPMVWDLSL
ncbi:solute carrier family 13 (sodium-dependent dicarboxylate transporter), member 2/3/5 [Maribacter dokdonensis]|uniref:Solute carrier family 13 (Sodium-dependent dicarboxylate transporter), member 2/3/5 n=1 Tax=Maribacter dokdonensis TaxID=320912 RepID=A0ABY0UFJ0_9FLAO|nr:SLC13 family permease [Maribacter dokdonensis]SDS59979.1 solute carrier family 13 (sodium-dependent dicarboxylate transporter), member 2/3/5 [Maribacter dokdonensis]